MKRLLSLGSLVLLSLVILGSFGCEQSDLGRYCVVGFDNSSGGEGVKAINSEAPECLDRICILQTKVVTNEEDEKVIETTQFCSKKCSADGDCSGADSQANCNQGFVCILLGEESQDLAGKCICECKDFLTTPDLCYSRCSNTNRQKDDCCNGDDIASCPENMD
ncbi:hypothetical protein KKF84_04650 [Myxococcota bacterium]|nr:hypothetical protein [Myxococcota bacterium]MBU1534586.1 hypothetical protein [Myxococcota bacterium]